MNKLLAAKVVAIALVFSTAGTCQVIPHTLAPAATTQAYITGYSYFDNTPPGSAAVSHPVIHEEAGGTGTYADPITVAVGHTLKGGEDILDLKAGTKVYIPELKRYFIVEDTCGDGNQPQNGPCHTGYPDDAQMWLDIWVDGRNGSSDEADACMENLTKVYGVVIDPAVGLSVTPGAVC